MQPLIADIETETIELSDVLEQSTTKKSRNKSSSEYFSFTDAASFRQRRLKIVFVFL